MDEDSATKRSSENAAFDGVDESCEQLVDLAPCRAHDICLNRYRSTVDIDTCHN